MPTRRRQARILALQALYEGDTTGHDPLQALERMLIEAGATEESADFARELVEGAVEHARSSTTSSRGRRRPGRWSN